MTTTEISTAFRGTLDKYSTDELYDHLEAVERERELTLGLLRIRKRIEKRGTTDHGQESLGTK